MLPYEKERVARILTGLLEKGHFVNTAGTHGDVYINKRLLSRRREEFRFLADRIANQIAIFGLQGVVVPARGAIPLGRLVVSRLSLLASRPVPLIIARKSKHGFSISPRDRAKLAGKMRTAVVEDVINSGSSTRKVVEIAREAGADILTVACLWNRGTASACDFGNIFKFIPLRDERLNCWTEEECPLCPDVPIREDLGHGRAFLEQKNERLRLRA